MTAVFYNGVFFQPLFACTLILKERLSCFQDFFTITAQRFYTVLHLASPPFVHSFLHHCYAFHPFIYLFRSTISNFQTISKQFHRAATWRSHLIYSLQATSALNLLKKINIMRVIGIRYDRTHSSIQIFLPAYPGKRPDRFYSFFCRQRAHQIYHTKTIDFSYT